MQPWFDMNAAVPGLRGAAVHVLASRREAEVRRVLEDAAFGVRTVEGGLVLSDRSFFQEAVRALGVAPHFGHNWDALQDVLGDLADAPDRRIAVIWRDADKSFEADPQTVVDAFVALSRAAEDLASEVPITQLEVFLLGAGPGFDQPSG